MSTTACPPTEYFGFAPEVFAGGLVTSILVSSIVSALATWWYMRRRNDERTSSEPQEDLYDVPPDALPPNAYTNATNAGESLGWGHRNRGQYFQNESENSGRGDHEKSPTKQAPLGGNPISSSNSETATQSSVQREVDDRLEDDNGYVIMEQSLSPKLKAVPVPEVFFVPVGQSSLATRRNAEDTLRESECLAPISTSPTEEVAPPIRNFYDTVIVEDIDPSSCPGDSSLPPPRKPKPIHMKPSSLPLHEAP